MMINGRSIDSPISTLLPNAKAGVHVVLPKYSTIFRWKRSSWNWCKLETSSDSSKMAYNTKTKLGAQVRFDAANRTFNAVSLTMRSSWFSTFTNNC